MTSAQSPSTSSCRGLAGGGGGGGGDGVLFTLDAVESIRLTGGGAKLLFRANAGGAGGATGGGVALLFAVELRRDENIAFPEEMSMSPNFF